MAATSLISVRVPPEIAERLEHLAQAIHEGLNEIEQGQVIDFIDVKKELGLNSGMG